MKMKKYEITTEEYEAVVKARKATQNKRIARRLRVIELRYEGKTSKEIAEKLDMNWMYISEIVKRFKRQGLEEFARNKYTSHNRAGRRYSSRMREKSRRRPYHNSWRSPQGTECRNRGNYRSKLCLSCFEATWLGEENAAAEASKVSRWKRAGWLKKIKSRYDKLVEKASPKRVRILFQDEAGFGRISKPKACWCRKGVRPTVPCHHIREYRYVYGAVEPETGDGCFWVMTRCDTESMNFFLEKLSEQYTDDYILLICDGAAWHKSTELIIPENIELFFIPPYTPEMNPIEQIWKEIRKRGFQNEVFDSLEAVIDRLCFTIKNLPATVIKSITGRKWILSIF